ncbi:methylmalonyl-CoA mutase [Porphyromonadaceae bacterium COT-184 OH4590]|nr:methylmalonyl-CoA mutase [Porphyromonadaceae bacterium COT-184 OH4590]MDO4726108.1 methylmalonyl-CoA mutase small subunit [Porphyromonadaceae bacterium]
MAEKKLNILADFPAITTEEWMAKINADLKGADFTKKLVWKTSEGFNVNPFYRLEDVEGMATLNAAPGKFPYVRGTKEDNNWFVRQEIVADDPVAANKEALEVLQEGINSIGFKVSKDKLSAKFIEELLKGIDAQIIELNFQICVRRAKELTKILVDYFQTNKYDLSKMEGSINFDPINRMLIKGTKLNVDFVKDLIVPLVKEAQNLPKYRVVNINASSLNDAGAYSTQELGYALAWGEQYLNLMVEAGIDVCTAAKSIKFNFGVGGNYFMEIAKFRAARMLWAKIVEAYKPTDENAAKMRIHAKTSMFNKTIYDAHVNMLRTQTEAMSAIIAGVDSLTVVPFDSTYQVSDKFAERIAKNQQLLLKEESNFDKVVDVSAGSYYIENLTANIAKEAWKIFLQTEEQGFFKLVLEGKIQEDIKKVSDDRLKKISSRREILLGTNQFPNFTEVAAEKIKLKSADCNCGHGELPTLPNVRAAEQFETLRLATEKAAKRPKAFMLTIGNLAMRLARAQFSCNFFACAGYEVIDNLGFSTIEDGVAAAQKVGADIIVLCSSDDEYETLAPEAFRTIGGKQIFVVAGAPACMEELQKIGIEHFINVKTNVLEALKMYSSKLGI